VSTRLRPPALALAALLVSAAGCGDIDGSKQPFPGTVLYQDLMGRFEMRLLVPPWIPIPPITGDTTIFVVMSDSVTLASQESDALYSLDVNTVDGSAQAALTAAAKGPPAWDLSKQKPVKTTSGAAGAEVSWQESPTVYHREVFLGAATASTFHLHFTAKKPIADDDMITQMILSFTPRVAVAPIGGSR
jgi:hypothetical protein